MTKGIVAAALAVAVALAAACTFSSGPSKYKFTLDWKTYHKKHALAFPAEMLPAGPASLVIVDASATSQTKRGKTLRWVIEVALEYTNRTARAVPNEVIRPTLRTGLDCSTGSLMLIPSQLPPGWEWRDGQPVHLSPAATGRATFQVVCSGADLFAAPIELTSAGTTVVLTPR